MVSKREENPSNHLHLLSIIMIASC